MKMQNQGIHNAPSEHSAELETRAVPRRGRGCHLAGSMCSRSCPDYGKSINGSGQSLLQCCLSPRGEIC